VSRARDIVEVVGRALADRSDDVSVSEREGREATHIELSSTGRDLGRMIGRQGRTASSIRALAELVAEPEGRRVVVDFVDTP
jgi:hypothetical protein|tara:strand:- start:321 stop:566 length:246 start_codon:yes stop_codon:yes gene_type:complete